MGLSDGIGHLPLSWLALEDIPAVPFELDGLLDSDFLVQVDLGPGSGRAEIITTDLTPEYVRFNGERS